MEDYKYLFKVVSLIWIYIYFPTIIMKYFIGPSYEVFIIYICCI